MTDSISTEAAAECVGVADKDFTSVWKGETMTRFREAHLKGEIPDVCTFCYKTEKRAKGRSNESAHPAIPLIAKP